MLVSGSAIGIYGPDRGDEVLTEASPAGQGFLCDVVRAWEAASKPAEDAGLRVVHARTGLVLSPRGGAMARLLPLARLGLAGPLGRAVSTGAGSPCRTRSVPSPGPSTSRPCPGRST